MVKDGYNKNSIISGTVKIFFGTKSMTNSIFKALDNDQNDIITLQECDNYARQKCNHSLIELWNLSVADVCILIENLSKK